MNFNLEEFENMLQGKTNIFDIATQEIRLVSLEEAKAFNSNGISQRILLDTFYYEGYHIRISTVFLTFDRNFEVLVDRGDGGNVIHRTSSYRDVVDYHHTCLSLLLENLHNQCEVPNNLSSSFS